MNLVLTREGMKVDNPKIIADVLYGRPLMPKRETIAREGRRQRGGARRTAAARAASSPSRKNAFKLQTAL